jgi:uncharacterized protein
MRGMTDSRAIPVFPLPDVVFFPKTVLPLHVFETRYRIMVKDALASDARLAVALLQPGWEKGYAGAPAYHPVATIGRMEEIESTADGRYYFRLVGEARVRLGAIERDKPYRLARAVVIRESAVDEDDASIRRAKLDMLASQGCLLRELSRGDYSGLILDERVPFEAVVNGVCASLPAEAALKQSLLELDDLLERHRRASALLDDVLQRVLHLKSLRSRDEGPTGLN